MCFKYESRGDYSPVDTFIFFLTGPCGPYGYSELVKSSVYFSLYAKVFELADGAATDFPSQALLQHKE